MTTLILCSWRQSREPVPVTRHTIKAGELIDYLKDFDEETPVIIEGFDGHLFCEIRAENIEAVEDLEAYPRATW